VNVSDSIFSDNGYLGLAAVSLLDGNVDVFGVTAQGNDGLGVMMGSMSLDLSISPFNINVAPSETGTSTLACSMLTGNAAYGLGAMSNTVISGNDLYGNGMGEYATEFGALITEGAPVNCQPGGGGPSDYMMKRRAALLTTSSCSDITLSEGGVTAVFHELCGHAVGLEPPVLPGDLPSGATLASSVTVLGDLPQPDGSVTLSFPIPTGADPAKLALLFWNGAKWQQVSGGSVVDGLWVTIVKEAGPYVLVQQ